MLEIRFSILLAGDHINIKRQRFLSMKRGMESPTPLRIWNLSINRIVKELPAEVDCPEPAWLCRPASVSAA